MMRISVLDRMEERQNSEVRSIAVLVLGLGVYFCWQFVNMSASLFETFVASLSSLSSTDPLLSLKPSTCLYLS